MGRVLAAHRFEWMDWLRETSISQDIQDGWICQGLSSPNPWELEGLKPPTVRFEYGGRWLTLLHNFYILLTSYGNERSDSPIQSAYRHWTFFKAGSLFFFLAWIFKECVPSSKAYGKSIPETKQNMLQMFCVFFPDILLIQSIMFSIHPRNLKKQPLKIDHWKTSFLWVLPIFRGFCC